MKFSDLSNTSTTNTPQAAAIEDPKPVYTGPGQAQKLNPKQLALLIFNKVDKMYPMPILKDYK